jgi:hypothetical protein
MSCGHEHHEIWALPTSCGLGKLGHAIRFRYLPLERDENVSTFGKKDQIQEYMHTVRI